LKPYLSSLLHLLLFSSSYVPKPMESYSPSPLLLHLLLSKCELSQFQHIGDDKSGHNYEGRVNKKIIETQTQDKSIDEAHTHNNLSLLYNTQN
jgi:hypothetical protein